MLQLFWFDLWWSNNHWLIVNWRHIPLTWSLHRTMSSTAFKVLLLITFIIVDIIWRALSSTIQYVVWFVHLIVQHISLQSIIDVILLTWILILAWWQVNLTHQRWLLEILLHVTYCLFISISIILQPAMMHELSCSWPLLGVDDKALCNEVQELPLFWWNTVIDGYAIWHSQKPFYWILY